MTPPEFAGVASVELRGFEFYHLTWEPATDDVSAPEAIQYQVFHIVEPYRQLDRDTSPIATSDPGATSITLANDAPPGRYYVRAVDEAGNRSAITSGIAQRARRPWVRASDGTLLAQIRDCVAVDDGALCVGEDGFVARWTEGAWQPIEAGTAAALRVAETIGGLFVYSDVGHLFTVGDDGALSLVDVRFTGSQPELPFRQFTADDLGLRYWIDGAGKLFVGADREFLSTDSPLALPSVDECARLRGLGFTAAAAFALCENGAAFSSNQREAGRMWQSLTPNAVFPLRGGIRQLYADADNEVILADEIGVRRVGVGGWSPLLLTEYPDTVHPLDIPRSGPRPTRMGRMMTDDSTFYVVSDLGLLERQRDSWDVVNNTEGALVGAIEDGRSWQLFYEDGSVATLRYRQRSWDVPPATTGFSLATQSMDGALLASIPGGEPDEGIWRWTNEGWDRVTSTPLPAADVRGLRAAGDALLAFGTDSAGAGAVWRLSRGSWSTAALRVPPPPEPVDDEPAAAAAPDAEPPPPEPPPALRGVSAASLDRPPVSMQPVTDADVAADGRAIAVAGTQVWWWLGDAWLLLTERPGTIDAVALDSGESYVLIEGGVVTRCWRDVCGAPVPESTWAPETVARTWRGPSGLVAMAADGSTFLFSAGSPPSADAEPLIDPAAELTAGIWVEEAGPLAADVRGDTVDRWVADGVDVVRTSDGSVLAYIADRWVMQGQRDDALALVGVRGGWALLTAEGLLAPGDVPVARRSASPERNPAGE